jgi:hypothetical protein
LVDKDPEQDVRGIAIPVIDALVEEAKSFLGDDRVLARVEDVLSAEAYDGYVRAADLLIVVRVLEERVGKPPPGMALELRPWPYPRGASLKAVQQMLGHGSAAMTLDT